MIKKKVGVVIMRAQGYHKQHHEHVQRSAAENSTTVVLFGSANARISPKNPFTVNQRIGMLYVNVRNDPSLANSNILGIGINNHPSDITWRDNVLSKMEIFGGDEETEYTLYGSNKDASSFYLELFPTWNKAIIPITTVADATTIRDLYFKGKQTVAYLRDYPHITEATLNSLALMKYNAILQNEYEYYQNEAVLFGNYKYPETLNFCCADNVVIVNGKVLMVERGNSKMPGFGCIALPAGFKNNNETFFEAGLRELNEETCIQVSRQTLLDSHMGSWMFDNPKRSLGLTRCTMAAIFDLSHLYEGEDRPLVTPKDDARATLWVDIEKLYTMENVYDDHAKIVYDMIQTYIG